MTDGASGETSQRIPPFNIEAERSVLGSILLDNSAYLKVGEVLDANDFYSDKHRKIYTAMGNLFRNGGIVDFITLKEALQSSKNLSNIGGTEYLFQLAEGTATAIEAGYHARIVKQKSIARRIIAVCTDLVGNAYQPTDDIGAVLREADEALFEVIREASRGVRGFKRLQEFIKPTVDRIDQYRDGKPLVSGLRFGVDDFDKMTTGLHPGEMIILAARPSVGKTAFALNVARFIAVLHETPIAFFSLEMGGDQLALRLLAFESGIDLLRLRSGILNKGEYKLLTESARTLSGAPIFINDSSDIKMDDIRSQARKIRLEENIGLVVIDYLQIIPGQGKRNENRQQEITEISRSIKAMARELEVPVMAISQMSRSVEQRREGRARPQLSDLRESGALEQDADLVVFLHRAQTDDGPEPESGPDSRGYDAERGEPIELIIGKQRNGPIGTIDMVFMKSTGRFYQELKEPSPKDDEEIEIPV